MSKLKQCFTSRWPRGMLVVADYSQLEVVCLAIASKDTQLIQDLRDGIDLHTMRAEELFGAPVSKEQRQKAKELSFQLQYGAGAKGMAKKLGIDYTLAQEFIKNYFNRYPELDRYYKNLFRELNDTKYYTGMKDEEVPVSEAIFTSPTGRRYWFREYDSQWGVKFSPTELKNYPIQGFAGGDVMSLAVSSVYNELIMNNLCDGIKLVNTVHDNIIADCSDESIRKCCNLFRRVLNDIGRKMELVYGINTFGIQLKVEVSKGNSLADLHPA